MEISRRGFLTLGGILGASAVLPGCARKAVLQPKEESLGPLGKEELTHSVCGLCPSGCAVQVRLVDGRAVGVSGTPDHPINQGTLCPKGAALLQELYHPDRLKSPLARAGNRGEGKWIALSWEEAIRRVAAKLSEAAAAGKPAAALGSPRGWDIDGEILENLVRSFGGGCFTQGVAQNELSLDAYQAMHGGRGIVCDPAGARLLVSFGFDWLQSHPHHVEAQRLWSRLRSSTDGVRAHIVSVESRFSVTAAKADSWVPVRPGSEGFLALGAAREMIAVDRYDRAFIGGHTLGFEDFRKAVEPFSIARVSEATGLPEKDVRLLCAKFQRARPAVAIAGRGAPWSQMAVHALNALSGSLGVDGIFSMAKDADASAWGEMDLRATPPAVLLIDRVNPLFLSPARWKTALEKAPFIVTASPYFTETAEFSDIVLPCGTPLERLHASRHQLIDGRTVLNAAARAVAPLHDTKDPGEIFMLIGRAAGVRNIPSGDFAARLDAKVRELGGGRLSLKAGEGGWLETPREAGRLFANRSGRFDFSQLTKMLPQAEARRHAVSDKDFPLSLHAYAPLAFSRGEGAHLPYLQSLAGIQSNEMWESWAEIHPETAAACGIKDGEKAWISSKLGKIQIRACVLPSAMPGVVSVPIGLGHTSYGRWAKGVGANPMAIAEDFDGTPVRLERA